MVFVIDLLFSRFFIGAVALGALLPLLGAGFYWSPAIAVAIMCYLLHLSKKANRDLGFPGSVGCLGFMALLFGWVIPFVAISGATFLLVRWVTP